MRGMQRRVPTIALLATVMLVAAACSNSPKTSGSTSKKTIKIGAILEFTGKGAAYGKSDKEVIELALAQQNHQVAGHPIEVVYEDDATDPGQAVTVARKLIQQDRVDVLIGPNFSDAKVAVASFLKTQNVMGNLLFGAPQEAGQSGRVISYPGSTQSFCPQAGTWAFDQGYRTMATLGADYVAGTTLINPIADEFKKKGGQVVQQQWAPLGTTDFGPYLTRMRHADVIVAWTVMPDELAFMQQYFQFGLKAPLVLCEADNVSPDQLKQVGPQILGTKGIVSAYVPQLDNPKNKAFVEAMQKRYGRNPTIYDGTMYIPWEILMAGLEKTGGDASLNVLYPAILGMTVDTAGGEISFTKDGFTKSNRYMAEVKKVNGTYEWVPFQTYSGVTTPGGQG